MILLTISLVVNLTWPLLMAPPAFADTITYRGFDSLDIKDGLSDNIVWGIGQDDQGFMWFGTLKGLNRYDGYDIKTYLPTTVSSQKSEFEISGLLVGKDNRIWLWVQNSGIMVFDPASDEFSELGFLQADSTPTNDWKFVEFSEGLDGDIWVLTDGEGVVRIETSSIEETPSWVWFKDPPLNGEYLTSICSLSEGTTWIGSDKGEILVLDTQGVVTETLLLPLWDEIHRPRIQTIFEARSGAMWIGTNVGFFRHERLSGEFVLLQPQPTRQLTNFNVITSFSEDSSGILWLGSYVGLYRFDPSLEQFELNAHNPTDPGSFLRGPVIQTFCGKSGVVWSSCWFSGISIYDPTAINFSIEEHNSKDPDGLAEKSVHSLFEEPDGTLWVGTGFRGPGNSVGVLHRRVPGAAGFEHWDFPTNRVTSLEEIFRDDDGNLWIGTNAGLWRFVEGNSEPLVPAEGLQGSLAVSIMSLNDDEAGNLWIGTGNAGLMVRNRESGEVRHFKPDPGDDNAITGRNVGAIQKDLQGQIWLGMDSGGLLLFDQARDSFQRFMQEDGYTKNISSIVFRPDGGMWLGTYGGLVDFHPDSGIRRIYDKSSGLPNETVTQLQVDEFGNCWFPMGTGIVRLDPETERIRIFSDEDGLGEFGNCFAAIKRRSGTMMFGGAGGILEFDPAQFTTNDFQPPVVYSEITINGQPINIQSTDGLRGDQETNGRVDLAYNQNDIVLTFAALDYTATSGVLYRHFLEGFDPQWSASSKTRTVNYTNLDPGTYCFRVLASNNQGQWNTDEAKFDFVIHKPWWDTRWAMTGYIVLAVLLLFLVQRQQVMRQRIKRNLALNNAQARHLTEMSELKAKFLVNVAHEFRGPLTLIKSLAKQNGGSELNGNGRTQSMLERNAARLETLTEQLSALASLETGGVEINRSQGSTVILLRELAMMYRGVCKKRGVRFIFHGPDDKGEGWVDFNLLEKIFTNLMVNAVKTTDYRGVIDVRITLERDSNLGSGHQGQASEVADTTNTSSFWLGIEVTNSGSGNSVEDPEKAFDRFYTSSPDKKHHSADSGIGLTLIKEFALLLGGRVSAEATQEGSTCFQVWLPVMDSAPATQGASNGTKKGALSSESSAMVNGSLRVAEQMLAGRVSDSHGPRSTRLQTDFKSILVIDQDADMRSFLRSKLGEEFNIVEAIDGSSGLEIAVSDQPDLILCDERIGDMSCIEFCDNTKQKWRTQGIPVIIFVAGDDESTKQAAYEVGADDFIVKPYNFTEVRLRIINLIDQRVRVLARYCDQKETGNSSEPVVLPASEDDFMTNLNLIIEQNLEDPDFKIEMLASQLFMSRRTLQRKLLELTGQTGSNYLRNQRLQRAAQLLSQGYNNVMDVSLAVGYKNPSNFSRAFREYFGASPSEYRKAGL